MTNRVRIGTGEFACLKGKGYFDQFTRSGHSGSRGKRMIDSKLLEFFSRIHKGISRLSFVPVVAILLIMQ